MTATTIPMLPVSEALKSIHEQISHRAYELYEMRGRETGHEIEDWLRAEAEITGTPQ
jgi:hypothetical protein